MLARRIEPLLRARLRAYPAVAVVGPRQSGKTTLARSLGGHFFDLEQDADRLRLDLDWADLARGRELVVLDEAQEWPDVFPRLRGTIDADRQRNGRFLLLGSVSPSLMPHVSESLAGRLSLLELTPLARSELADEARLARHWLVGGYPDGGILTPERFPQWQEDHLSLLALRDLPERGLPAAARTTRRLFQLLAATHGQEWNASQLGRSLGLAYHTVNRYRDFLEGAFLIRVLPAYRANIRKRLVKRPKVFWRDSGLLHALLRVRNREALLAHPLAGASWEGYVVEQILTALREAGRSMDAYFLRTSDHKELDLVLEAGAELWALEIKLTTAPRREDMARLNAHADLIGAGRRFLVTRQRGWTERGSQIVCDLESFLREAAG